MLHARFSHLYFRQSLPTLQRGLYAIADLLVEGCGAKEHIMEFPNKGCGLRGLDKFLKKQLETGMRAINEVATLKAYRISIVFFSIL